MENHTIFVSHLSPHTSTDDLEDFFRTEFNNVIKAKISIDHVTGNSRETGFVKVSVNGMSEVHDGIKKLDQQNLDGYTIHVKYNKTLDINAQHLWDNHHYPGGRSRSHYRDYNHFRDEHRNHYRHPNW